LLSGFCLCKGIEFISEMDTFVRLILWSGYKIDGGRENLQVNNVDFISLRVEGDHILFIP
jgi:hypothetical protein